MLLGVLPFGLIYGALALQAGIPPMAALAMSSIVLAGSAQFVGTQLFAADAPGALIILTTFVVNLRHMLYSASVAPYLSQLGLRWKLLLAYLLSDEAYAMAITHYREKETQSGSRAVRRSRHQRSHDCATARRRDCVFPGSRRLALPDLGYDRPRGDACI